MREQVRVQRAGAVGVVVKTPAGSQRQHFLTPQASRERVMRAQRPLQPREVPQPLPQGAGKATPHSEKREHTSETTERTADARAFTAAMTSMSRSCLACGYTAAGMMFERFALPHT